jgi:hypothetical protein
MASHFIPLHHSDSLEKNENQGDERSIEVAIFSPSVD